MFCDRKPAISEYRKEDFRELIGFRLITTFQLKPITKIDVIKAKWQLRFKDGDFTYPTSAKTRAGAVPKKGASSLDLKTHVDFPR